MKRLVLFFATILSVTTNLFSQKKFSVSASVGVLDSFGTAQGIEIGCKQSISDHLSFQFVAAYYSWSSNKDLNAFQQSTGQYINSLDYYLHHVRKEISALIPIRLGLNYAAGNSSSHPYFGVEWTLNMLFENTFLPQPVSNTSIPFTVAYSQLKSSPVFVSIGFDMGYSFRIANNVNASAGVKYQAGKMLDYVSFVGGFEYFL